MVGKLDDKFKRMIKTQYELSLIKQSAKISNSCIKLVSKKLAEENVTEKELANCIDSNIRNQGAELAFPTIVTCGKRSVHIHAKPTKKVISGLGYADFGAKYKGYCTDITVPFVKGTLSDKETLLVKDTLKLYDRLLSSIKLDMHCWKLHKLYSEFLKKRGYDIKHSLGHGLGMDIHEFPYITMPRNSTSSRKSRRWKKIREIKFSQGMVFTIEPGIYVKGVGGCRIENSIYMNKTTARLLTNSKLIRVNDKRLKS